MQYGTPVGYAGIQARKIPRAISARWKMMLRNWAIQGKQLWGKGVEDRILYLVEQDLKENWTEELEQAFKKIYRMEE